MPRLPTALVVDRNWTQHCNLISQYGNGPTISTASCYHFDALLWTRALTDELGDVTDTYLQDAWGNEIAAGDSTVDPFHRLGQVGCY